MQLDHVYGVGQKQAIGQMALRTITSVVKVAQRDSLVKATVRFDYIKKDTFKLPETFWVE